MSRRLARPSRSMEAPATTRTETKSFSWTVASRPKASLIGESPFTANNDRNADTTTVTPDVAGVYTFALRVEDPSGALSDSAFVIVEATPGLDLPIADAGVNQSGLEDSEICLDGSESYDPNGHDLTYQWTMVAVPDASNLDTGSITTADAAACITPDAPGSYSLALVVNNGIVDSEPAAFISAGSTNQGPIAVAELLDGASCDFVRLSGANSSDPEGDELSYRWEVLVVPPDSSVLSGLTPSTTPRQWKPTSTPTWRVNTPSSLSSPTGRTTRSRSCSTSTSSRPQSTHHPSLPPLLTPISALRNRTVSLTPTATAPAASPVLGGRRSSGCAEHHRPRR